MRKSVVTILSLALGLFHYANSQSVAILATRYTGSDYQVQDFARNLPEMLSTELSQSQRVTLVERSQIQRVMGEISFEQSGNVDVSQAAEWGRLAGANYVILSNLTVLAGVCRIDARVVTTQTGVVYTSSKVEGSLKDPFALVNSLSSRLMSAFTGEQHVVDQPQVGSWTRDFAIRPAIDMAHALDAFSGGTVLWENSNPPFTVRYKVAGGQGSYASAVDVVVNDVTIANLNAGVASPGTTWQDRLQIGNGIYECTVRLNQMSIIQLQQSGNKWIDALTPSKGINQVFITVQIQTVQ
jgi:TolB-like protein